MFNIWPFPVSTSGPGSLQYVNGDTINPLYPALRPNFILGLPMALRYILASISHMQCTDIFRLFFQKGLH